MSWDEYHRALASIAAEMIGSRIYFDEHPDEATDERLAAAYRRYTDRLRAVEQP